MVPFSRKTWKVMQLISVSPFVIYLVWLLWNIFYAYITNEVYDFPQDNMGINIYSSFESAQFELGMITMGIAMVFWPVLLILCALFIYSTVKLIILKKREN